MTQPPKPAPVPAPPRPTYGLVAVAVPSGRVTRPVFGRHGFAEGALVTDWPAIVGAAIAHHTLPVRIRFPAKERTDGTLIVKVASGAFALEMQHLEPLILEKINGYFGWNAVARLRLIQGPLPETTRRKPPAPEPPPLPPDSQAAINLARVEDPDLREALARLGRRIAKS
ncbi:DUF721 domain-containing protein [Magnetospirillum molischianum]|uniref:DUF721 domain-containing protein n=1 Tax=Magnetospirillum molischianum DSM 120 TaxID=1150626 RepID=H8FX57_MAGML|nr:DUF721 domain-containing protein [Magnetospirillum molischianum]CCG42945.1 conserved hypothetical protein [Magnetospirillum molischianum DSM 120]